MNQENRQDNIEQALYIAQTIKEHLEGNISSEKQAFLDQWLASNDQHRKQFEKIKENNFASLQDGLLELESYNTAVAAKKIFTELGLDFSPETEPEREDIKVGSMAGRGNSRRNLFKWTAAAAIFIIIGTAYLIKMQFFTSPKEAPGAKTVANAVPIQPGSAQATLTLADGSTVILDSSGNNKLQTQVGASVQQLAGGQLVYKTARASTTGATTYNTMSTPRGGEFKLVLADGTKVWLNSASSIIYPISFSGAKERRVELSGEAYFEVTHNKNLPFKVVVNGTEIQVLGTHFNVNAYHEIGGIKATLLEGSIRLLTASGKSAIIKPGQQAEVGSDNQIKVNNNVDLQQITAWQQGLFEFNNTTLPVIMEQISRWYNVDIHYEEPPGKATYGGAINRKQPLATVLKLLEANGVHFELDGRTLTVKSRQ